MDRSRGGFTLVEIMVVLSLVAILLALGLSFYRQGFTREYYYSSEQRRLQSALQVARMRAIAGDKYRARTTAGVEDAGNRAFSIIQNGRSLTPKSSDYYSRVQFTTTAAHGLSVGDYVTFSGLTKHTGMNGGIFCVDVVPSTTTFECPYYTKVPDTDLDASGALARSVNRAAKLVLVKESSNPTDAQRVNVDNFVYDDARLTITDQLGSSTIVVGFDSRGFASNSSGYTLYMTGNPPKTDQTKLITVTPFGKVKAGK